MDYARIYSDFIAARRGREALLPRPFDEHHILPRCLGGNDEPENIVKLSPEDHLFAHILLAKVHGGNLVRAAYGMMLGERYLGRRSRMQYARLRVLASISASKAVRDANERRGHGARLGISHTAESKAKMSANRKGVKTPGRKVSELGRAGLKKSLEHRAKIGASVRRAFAGNPHPSKGQRRSDEVRAKISAGVCRANDRRMAVPDTMAL